MSEQEDPKPVDEDRERANTGEIKPPTKGDTDPPGDGEPQGGTTTP